MGTRYDEFKEYVLIPYLYDHLDEAFKEMHFRRKGNHWESSYHLDGRKDGQGKAITAVYGNSKFCAIDHSNGEKKGLIDLYMNLHSLDFLSAVTEMADRFSLELPSEDGKEWKSYEETQSNRQRADKAFREALWSGTDEADEVLSYLVEKRKWTLDDIKKSGLGLVTTEILASLPDGKTYEVYSREKDTDRVNGSTGTTHRLVIPYKNGSRIFGFKFRDINDSTDNKYLNTRGITKTNGLFGIGMNVKELVIVEGELDALHAQVLGAENVVATAGSRASETQIRDAVKRGVERFTLLFDNDKAGYGFIVPTIEEIRKAGKNIFVASFPEEGEDTDKFLQKHTIEDFRKLIDEAVPYSVFMFDEILKKYISLEEEKGTFTRKDKDDFFNEVDRLMNSPYTLPYNREEIRQAMENSALEQGLLFTMEEFNEWVDGKYLRNQEQKREKEVRESFTQISSAIQGGNIDEALRLMRETSDKQKSEKKEVQFAKVFSPTSPEAYSSYLSEIKEGVPTGIAFYKGNIREELTLNSGLTFVCAYRGHGKTSFLNNIALNDAKRNLRLGNGKSVLYFSYEVDKRRLIADLLNTYVNDKDISLNPSNTIQAYFKGKDYFRKKDDYGNPTDKYKKNFIIQKDKFLKDYLSSGALVVVEENYKVEELLQAIKWYISKKKVSIICIDYAQLIYSEDYTRQRTEEIKKVVNDIKDFANKEGIPFVLAAQFNREVDSPISVDTKNIGEGGDFERIADTCIGLFNLKEFHPLPKNQREENEACKLLQRLTGQMIVEAKPIENKIFVRLMKRRYGYYPLDILLDWEGRTKYIKPNNPEALEQSEEQRQADLFSGNDELDLPAF